MSNLRKMLLLEVWFFILFPILGWFLEATLGQLGLFLYFFLFMLWGWALFAFFHYRRCRQEEFLLVLSTAAGAKAPLESVLGAFLQDRPRGGFYQFWVGCLLFFVFPGYYWIHQRRSFDARMAWVAYMLERGVPLDQALAEVPGIVSRETALAVTVGQFTGRMAQALHDLPSRRLAPLWYELVPRLLYPLFLLAVMAANVSFLTAFILPKYERIFADFHLQLPTATRLIAEPSRWLVQYAWVVPVVFVLALVLIHVVLFNSRAKWYSPVVGRLYRLHARGQFLQVLGLMLETGKPLPHTLRCVSESRLLPAALETRVALFAEDLQEGRPLGDSLAKHGLATRSMGGLILAAEKAQNLPWALQELGDALLQRCARLGYRITMVLFPLTIFACACLVGFVALAFFMPLIAMLEGLHG